jgi:hypothetical protein
MQDPGQGKPSGDGRATIAEASACRRGHDRSAWPPWVATATLAITVIGLVLLDFNQQRRISQALAVIRSSGGVYARDETDRRHPVVSIEFDALLVDDAGHEHRKPPASDEILPRLSCFDRLRNLSLQRSAVTDAGLTHLAVMKNLRRLSLRGSPITDVGLRSLARMTWLEEIDLVETRATAPGVGELRRSLPRTLIKSDVR